MRISTHNLRLITCSIGFLFSGCGEQATIDVVQWISIGPSTEITSLMLTPTEPQILYAINTDHHLLRWDGTNWNRLLLSEQIEVLSVMMIPDKPTVILAGTNWGLLQSSDNGASWNELNLETDPQSGPASHVNFLAFAPSQTLTFYAQRYYEAPPGAPPYEATLSLMKSNDEGLNWVRLPLNLIHSLAIDPHQSWILYAAHNTGRPSYIDEIAISFDAGLTWSTPKSNISIGHQINTIRIAPTNPSTVYATTSEGLIASTSSNFSWENRNELILKTLEIYPLNPTILFGLQCEKIATPCIPTSSANEGRDWKPIKPLPLEGSALVIAQDGKRIFAGTNNGVFVGTLK